MIVTGQQVGLLALRAQGSRHHRCGRCQGQESLTAFSRTDRTVPDYNVYAGHLATR
jgi:hypothetical protein